jgi:hypothetical protein
MTTNRPTATGGVGHAFISYVTEDSERVDRIQAIIEAAGIPVWRDTENLWPGEDWRMRIREAITNDSLAFVACFSEHSEARSTSYQNEELLLAVEQFRLRPPGTSWLLPVRLSDCKLPYFDLGASRTLDSLQRLDLFGQNWDKGSARLVAGVLRILGDAQARMGSVVEMVSGLTAGERETALPDAVKGMLLDPQRQIELDDLLSSETNRIREQLLDENRFPTSSSRVDHSPNALWYIVEQCNQYWDVVAPLAQTLVVGCAWGQEQHAPLWARSIQAIAGPAARASGGQTVLLDLRRYPVLPILYAAGISSVYRQNFVSLRAVTSDARVQRDGRIVPLVGTAALWGPFSNYQVAAQVLALLAAGQQVTTETIQDLSTGRKGRRYTPVSDHLHDRLRQSFDTMIPEDADYTEAFDRLEVLLSLLAIDAKRVAGARGIYLDSPSLGAFTWRHRYIAQAIELVVHEEFLSAGAAWRPLQAGLMDGSAERAEAAFPELLTDAADARSRRF